MLFRKAESTWWRLSSATGFHIKRYSTSDVLNESLYTVAETYWPQWTSIFINLKGDLACYFSFWPVKVSINSFTFFLWSFLMKIVMIMSLNLIIIMKNKCSLRRWGNKSSHCVWQLRSLESQRSPLSQHHSMSNHVHELDCSCNITKFNIRKVNRPEEWHFELTTWELCADWSKRIFCDLLNQSERLLDKNSFIMRANLRCNILKTVSKLV